jgi:hypothetical protein
LRNIISQVHHPKFKTVETGKTRVEGEGLRIGKARV